jgi:hypothetical protein
LLPTVATISEHSLFRIQRSLTRFVPHIETLVAELEKLAPAGRGDGRARTAHRDATRLPRRPEHLQARPDRPATTRRSSAPPRPSGAASTTFAADCERTVAELDRKLDAK